MIWFEAGQWYAYNMDSGVLWAAPSKEECQDWLYGIGGQDEKIAKPAGCR